MFPFRAGEGVSKHVPEFRSGSIEKISRSLEGLFTHSILTIVVAEAGLGRHDPGPAVAKWKRLSVSMSEQQQIQKDGRPVLRMIMTAMQPDRHVDIPCDAKICRDEINVVLSFAGFRVREDGVITTAKKTSTLDEAQRRAKLLRSHLEQRAAHPEVIKHCRPDLLKSDYYEAVFESVKSIGARLRLKGDVDLDGRPLVQATLRGKEPVVKIAPMSTVTERNEQEGIALIAEGLFAAFRNPAAHEPRLTWSMTELDALDVLGTVSMIHRRPDGAI